MQLPADYHMHTPLCRHAIGEPAELAAQALKLGLPEIGFSDHNPMARDDFDDWRMRMDQLPEYIAKVEQARKAYPSLQIRIALEVDYLPGYEVWVRNLAERCPWDYLIGSVHYVSDDWALDNPQAISEWKKRDPYDVWSAYFDRLTMAAESRLFHIIGHADLCKKFCFYPQQDCTPMFAKFLNAAKKADVAIELNTAGLRKDCHEIYPGAAFLKVAREIGVAITFGSDAHAPGEVGVNFVEAVEAARAAGYSEYCRFRAGERVKVPIGESFFVPWW